MTHNCFYWPLCNTIRKHCITNCKRSFSEYDQEYLDISNLVEWKPLIYAVAFTHTTVQAELNLQFVL